MKRALLLLCAVSIARAASAADKEAVIGVAISITGPAASYGAQQKAGIQTPQTWSSVKFETALTLVRSMRAA